MKKISCFLSIILLLGILMSMCVVTNAEEAPLNGRKITFQSTEASASASVSAPTDKDFTLSFDVSFSTPTTADRHFDVRLDFGTSSELLWRIYRHYDGTKYILYFDIQPTNTDGQWWRIAEAFGNSNALQKECTLTLSVTRDIANHCFLFTATDTEQFITLSADWSKTYSGKNIGPMNTQLTAINFYSRELDVDYSLENFIFSTDGVSNKTDLAFQTAQGATVINVHTHIFGEWTTTLNATCVNAGSKEKACTLCSHKLTQTLPATGKHTLSLVETTTPATCSSFGKETVGCVNCTYETERTALKTEHTPSDTYTVDLAPTYVSYGFESKHCTVCDEKILSTEKKLDKLTVTVQKEEEPTKSGCASSLFALTPLACLLALPFLKRKKGKQIFSLVLCLVLIFPLVSVGTIAEEKTENKVGSQWMYAYNVLDYGVVNNSTELQTEQIQAVLDKCLEHGGTVIFPEGTYYTASLYVHSNTTIHLCANTTIFGSDDCMDYVVYDVPDGYSTYTDDIIYDTDEWGHTPRHRTAIFNAYVEENICVEGEGVTSVVDGQMCFDAEGEEGFHGPKGCFFSNCKNVIISNYTSSRTGSFHYHIDAGDGIYVEKLNILAGSDGLDFHGSKNVRVVDSSIHCGDDCVAAVNVENLYLNNCDLNTACNGFRTCGTKIVVENCKIWGPSIYPHRPSVTFGKDNILPDTEGRHNFCSLITYATAFMDPKTEACDFTFRNCEISTITNIVNMVNHPETSHRPFGVMSMENCTITEVATYLELCNVTGGLAEFFFKNTTATFVGATDERPILNIPKDTTNIRAFYED